MPDHRRRGPSLRTAFLVAAIALAGIALAVTHTSLAFLGPVPFWLLYALEWALAAFVAAGGLVVAVRAWPRVWAVAGVIAVAAASLALAGPRLLFILGIFVGGR